TQNVEPAMRHKFTAVGPKLKTEEPAGQSVERNDDLDVEKVGRRSEAGSDVVDSQERDSSLCIRERSDWKIGVHFKSAAPICSCYHHSGGRMHVEAGHDRDGQSVIVGSPGPRRTLVCRETAVDTFVSSDK